MLRPRRAPTAVPPRTVAGAVAVVCLLTGCAVVHKGDVQPGDVEKKAHTLVQQTLTAIRPVAGNAKATVVDQKWTRCSTEEPGQHRFDYSIGVSTTVPAAKAKAALAAVRAEYKRRGYRIDYVPHPDTSVAGSIPKANWFFGVDIRGTTSLRVDVDSDCVFTRHDPEVKRS